MFYDNDDIYTTEYSSQVRAWVVIRITGGKSESVAIGNTEKEALSNWKRERLYNHVTKH